MNEVVLGSYSFNSGWTWWEGTLKSHVYYHVTIYHWSMLSDQRSTCCQAVGSEDSINQRMDSQSYPMIHFLLQSGLKVLKAKLRKSSSFSFAFASLQFSEESRLRLHLSADSNMEGVPSLAMIEWPSTYASNALMILHLPGHLFCTHSYQ